MKLLKDEGQLNIKLPILGRKEYLASKSKDFGWFTNDNCAIAYYIDKKLNFKRMIFSTEVISKNSALTYDTEKDFLEQIIRYIKEHKTCDFIYKAQANVVFKSCPSNADCVEWGTYEIDLDKSSEELFLSFSGKCRNVIRKAKKENVIVQEIEDCAIIYENIKSMFNRQNSFHYPPYEYIKYLQDNLKNNVMLLIAMKDSVVQGSLILVYDETHGYAMYAGSIKSPQTGSLDLLHYEAMCRLQNKGVQTYDFVGTRINIKKGSKQEGIDRFKKKFNPTLKKGYAFKIIFNPLKHYIFDILVKSYFKVRGYKYIEAIEQIKIDNKKMLGEI